MEEEKMEDSKKIYWGVGITLLVFPIVGIAANAILGVFGLQLRMWLMVCIVVCLGIDIIVALGAIWWKVNCNHRSIATILLPFMLIIGGAVLYFGAMISAFAYEPEHVVEIKGTKMIARVDSFLDKSAYYYPYKNWLVCGKEQLGYAYFGSGGTDPYEYEDNPTPIRCHIEDEHGNILLAYGY